MCALSVCERERERERRERDGRERDGRERERERERERPYELNLEVCSEFSFFNVDQNFNYKKHQKCNIIFHLSRMKSRSERMKMC